MKDHEREAEDNSPGVVGAIGALRGTRPRHMILERAGTTVDFTLREHPRDSVNWRRYRDACPHYRVRWFVDSDPEAGEPFYQVYCLMNTPAQTWEEQEKCLASRTRCWRVAEAQKRAAGEIDIPLSSIKRRTPA